MEKKKLSEFLKENGAYESFIENCLNNKNTLQSIEDYTLFNIGINDGFTWMITPQGENYWEKLFDKCTEIAIFYDMDEVLYKEYEKRNMKESSEQNPITNNIVETGEEDTKQEFQTITLNGADYYLIPKTESPLLTLNDLRDVGLSEKDLLENGYSEEYLRKEPYEEYLKRKFEEGNGQYEVLFKEKKSKDWSFCYRPNDLSWRKDFDYKLIKKEHKEIIEAYLKDTTLKVQYRWHDEDWMLLEDFIENYDENMQLRIAKKEFKPFTLNIEVNTLDEAKSLWNRLVVSNSELYSLRGEFYKLNDTRCDNFFEIWDYLDDILKDLGERPDAN